MFLHVRTEILFISTSQFYAHDFLLFLTKVFLLLQSLTPS